MAATLAAPPPPEDILRSFNEILDLRRAYAWDRDQIFNFLSHVTANGYMYDIPGDRIQDLRHMVNEIQMLCPPDGTMFASPDLKPNQTTARTLNPEWDPANPSRSSKYLVREFIHDGIPFWGLFDILGLFLSSIGLAPSSATTRKFYLPLTAMYAKWCTTLGNLKPTMFNCTWIATGQDRGRFFLGASLKGYSAPLTIGPWASMVKAARFSLIDNEAMAMSGYTMNDCPEMRLTGNRVAFGNCAETYPLLHILKRTDPATVHGIALHVRGVIPPAYEDNLSGEVWTNVRSLCANCEELVRMWGGHVANFEPFADAVGAPP